MPSHCWECKRRRLVCDFTQPACLKCEKRGVTCPGYGPQKPVAFLAPGTVVSRRGKRQPKARAENLQESSSNPDTPSLKREIGEYIKKEVGDYEEDELSRSLIEECLGVPEFPLQSDAGEFGDVLYYFNEWIYPSTHAWILGPNPWNIKLEGLQFLPTSTIHGMMIFLYNVYRMYEVPSSDRDKAITKRLLRHKANTLQLLNNDMNHEQTRLSDGTLGTMILLLQNELAQEPDPVWRPHALAIKTMIELRGGFRHHAKNMKYLGAMLINYVITTVLADSTSPPSAHLNSIPLADLDALEELWTFGYAPNFPCSFDLFQIIIKVNYLRNQTDIPAETPQKLLEAALAFSPADFAATQPNNQREWLILTTHHQAAITLYLITSLHTPAAISADPLLHSTRLASRETLFSTLHAAARSPRLQNGILWGLAIAAFEVADDTAERRAFVVKRLKELRWVLASCLPKTILRVVGKFWAGKGRGWDDCFDRARALHI